MENQKPLNETMADEGDTPQEDLASRLFGLSVVLFGLVCGAAMLWFNGTLIRQWYHADNLLEGEAVITKTFLENHPKVNNKTGLEYVEYHPKVVFKLNVDGKTHQNEMELRVCSEIDDAMNILSHFPKNEHRNIFYNPSDPSEMHLSKDLPLVGPLIAFFLGMLFVASCGYGLFYQIMPVVKRLTRR